MIHKAPYYVALRESWQVPWNLVDIENLSWIRQLVSILVKVEDKPGVGRQLQYLKPALVLIILGNVM